MAQMMKLKKASRLIVAFMVIVFGATAAFLALQVATSMPFEGHWRLVSFETVDEQGTASPSPFTDGRIMYDDSGHMAAQLTHANRPPLGADATAADRAAAYGGYLAYYGTYRIDRAAGTVTHHVEGSTNPNWPGTDLVRHFAFADGGNTMRLSIENDAGRVTGTLTWARIR